jgi:hypothetical protein
VHRGGKPQPASAVCRLLIALAWGKSEPEVSRVKRAQSYGVPLLNVQQRPVIIREIAGVQDLDTCVVVAVERGDSAGAASLNRVGGVGKPDSEMVGLDRGWTRIKNEGLIVQDTGNVENSSSFSIGCQVALVPSWDKRRIGGGDYKEGEVGVRRKFEGFHVHVLHRTEIADGDPPARTGI